MNSVYLCKGDWDDDVTGIIVDSDCATIGRVVGPRMAAWVVERLCSAYLFAETWEYVYCRYGSD